MGEDIGEGVLIIGGERVGKALVVLLAALLVALLESWGEELGKDDCTGDATGVAETITEAVSAKAHEIQTKKAASINDLAIL